MLKCYLSKQRCFKGVFNIDFTYVSPGIVEFYQFLFLHFSLLTLKFHKDSSRESTLDSNNPDHSLQRHQLQTPVILKILQEYNKTM